LKNLFVVEFSSKQKWFRVDELEKVVRTNLRLILKKEPSDFCIVYIGTQKDCWDACDYIVKKFANSDGNFPVALNTGDSETVKRLKLRVRALEQQLEEILKHNYVEIREVKP